MKYEHLDFDSDHITGLFNNIEERLVIQTNNLEFAIVKWNEKNITVENAQKEYESKYHSNILKIVHGKIKTEEGKNVTSTMAKDVARAMCDEEIKKLGTAKTELASAEALVRIENEKVNTLKKLIDARSRLGG